MPMHVEMVTLVRNCKNHKVILSCKFLISMCCRPITHMLWANTWKYRTRQGTSWCHPNCVCLADKSWHLFWSMQSRSLWWSSSGHLVQRGRFRQPKQKQVILSSNPRLTSLMTVYKIPKLTWLLSCLAPIFWCRQGVHQFFFPHNLHSKRSQTFGWPFYIISISSAICSISSWVCLKIEDPPNFSRNDPFLDFETSDVIIFDAKIVSTLQVHEPHAHGEDSGNHGHGRHSSIPGLGQLQLFFSEQKRKEKWNSRWWIHLPVSYIVAFCYRNHCVQHLHDAHEVLANVIVLFGLFGDPLSQTAQTMLPSLLDRPSAKVLSGTPELWTVGPVSFLPVSFGGSVGLQSEKGVGPW